MAAAVAHGSYAKVTIAIVVMVILVVGTNFFVFRPLVAWSDKFRLESSESADKPKSIVLDLLRRSSIPRLAGRVSRPIGRALDRITRPFGLAEYPLRTDIRKRQVGDVIFWSVIVGASAAVAVIGLIYLNAHLGFARFPSLIGFGFATFARVVVLLVISTLIWVPVGVKIGMSPKLSRYAQPVVQVLASFPAILLFPFATLIFIDLGIPLDYGAIVLMMLGAQWYILFNVIAGASAIPNDLREMMVVDAPHPAPALAPGHPAGHLPRLRDRRDHRGRRGLERLHRGRAGQLAPPHPQRLRARQLHRHRLDPGQVRPPHRRRHRHERLRRHRQPAVLAAPVPPGREPVHAVIASALTRRSPVRQGGRR